MAEEESMIFNLLSEPRVVLTHELQAFGVWGRGETGRAFNSGAGQKSRLVQILRVSAARCSVSI